MIKYIGSKRVLLTYILSAVGAAVPAGATVLDLILRHRPFRPCPQARQLPGHRQRPQRLCPHPRHLLSPGGFRTLGGVRRVYPGGPAAPTARTNPKLRARRRDARSGHDFTPRTSRKATIQGDMAAPRCEITT
jgi:hypothetical protein